MVAASMAWGLPLKFVTLGNNSGRIYWDRVRTAIIAPNSHNLANLLLLRGALPEIATLKRHRKEMRLKITVTNRAGPPNVQPCTISADSACDCSKPA
tara:strand:- start:1833 stop:2123 length:291 start_codon:yes stop_codon:yes gene_type:complete